LVAPHHGSKTSSLRGFVAATNPRHVIFSSGFRHHFGHPHEDVVNRYKTVKSSIWKTSEQGAITLTWSNKEDLVVVGQRERPVTSCLSCSAWWRHPVAPNGP
jgi:competence protein ComEC